jgi:hypothetical protein
MNQEVKKKWLEALRSGKYRQAKEALKVDDVSLDGQVCISSFCCLGVLCDLYAKELPQKAHWRDEEFCFEQMEKNYSTVFDEPTFIPVEKCETAVLPGPVMKWAGIEGSREVGVTKPILTPRNDEVFRLTSANDSGLDFTTIANIIEEQL